MFRNKSVDITLPRVSGNRRILFFGTSLPWRTFRLFSPEKMKNWPPTTVSRYTCFLYQRTRLRYVNLFVEHFRLINERIVSKIVLTTIWSWVTFLNYYISRNPVIRDCFNVWTFNTPTMLLAFAYARCWKLHFYFSPYIRNRNTRVRYNNRIFVRTIRQTCLNLNVFVFIFSYRFYTPKRLRGNGVWSYARVIRVASIVSRERVNYVYWIQKFDVGLIVSKLYLKPYSKLDNRFVNYFYIEFCFRFFLF